MKKISFWGSLICSFFGHSKILYGFGPAPLYFNTWQCSRCGMLVIKERGEK